MSIPDMFINKIKFCYLKPKLCLIMSLNIIWRRELLDMKFGTKIGDNDPVFCRHTKRHIKRGGRGVAVLFHD